MGQRTVADEDYKFSYRKLKINSEHAHIHNRRYPDTKVCAVCGKVFTPPYNHRKRAKVCSEECKRELNSNASSIPINQYAKDGRFIRSWKSATEAAKNLQGERTSIVICLKGRTKTALGYKRRYANEFY